jgi:mRNA-degrading endonuclease RelE of RelBE toxin-antitoxin system
MFTIEYSEGVAEDLADLRAFDRKRLLDRIEKQLTHEPIRETKHKKILIGLIPPWEYEEPIWELRVGEHRIFYDVDENAGRVAVRAIRRKPPHKTTEEIL